MISGGPSSGKSTTIELLRARGFQAVDEQARVILAEQMALGRGLEEIRSAGEEFQREILARQEAIERNLERHTVVFLDRGIPDGLAYERFLGLQPNPQIATAAKAATYRRVFILDTLHLDDDGSRIEDADDQARIHDAIVATYVELGHQPIPVPVMTPEERIAFILDRL